MKSFLQLGLLIGLTLSQYSFADLKTRILQIDYAEGNEEFNEVIIAKNNSILLVARDATFMPEIEEAYQDHRIVDITLDENKINTFQIIDDGDDILDFYTNTSDKHSMQNYTPSNVSSLDDAKRIFNYLKDRSKWFTQCFNRAHIWSKQMYDRDHVDSMKIFIFYTKKYRREIHKKWWFHVAPMISVNGDYYVMDKEFTKGPLTNDKWENIFTSKLRQKGIENYKCKVIKNISEYYDRENQNSEYCNILVSSMYYWMPLDLSRLDSKGLEQTKWENRDLKIATKNVFWGWKKVYKEIKE